MVDISACKACGFGPSLSIEEWPRKQDQGQPETEETGSEMANNRKQNKFGWLGTLTFKEKKESTCVHFNKTDSNRPLNRVPETKYPNIPPVTPTY